MYFSYGPVPHDVVNKAIINHYPWQQKYTSYHKIYAHGLTFVVRVSGLVAARFD